MMKNTKSIILMATLFVAVAFTSCNRSVKGKWSDKDKADFRKEMESVEELSVYGANKEQMIECYLSKCEQNYASFYEADQDEKGLAVLALSCSDEAMSNGSVKGTWSEVDKQKFRNDMNAVKELDSFGDKKSEWIECYLSKCEAKYDSFYKANQDEPGVTTIAESCTNEIILE